MTIDDIDQDDKKKKKSKKELDWKSKWEKDFGNICLTGAELLDDEPKIVSVSPAIDLSIGGVPEGTWMLLSGPEKCGKTTLALQIIANAQAQFQKDAYYISAEGRFRKLNLQSVKSLDISKINRIQSTQDKILSAEDLLNITMDIIKNHKESVVVIDSTSSLCSDKEQTEDLTASTRAAGPKLIASFCRRMGTVVPVQKTIVICIQHLIANTSGYGSPYMEDSGKFIQYQADIKLRAKGIEKWKNTEGKQIGQIVKWQVMSSALGPPGGEIENYIRYGLGIDSVQESMTLATELGIIQKAGSWLSSSFFEGKIQGEENLYKFLMKSPDVLHTILTEIKKLL